MLIILYMLKKKKKYVFRNKSNHKTQMILLMTRNGEG